MSIKALFEIWTIVDAWILDALGGKEFACDELLAARNELINELLEKLKKFPLDNSFLSCYNINEQGKENPKPEGESYEQSHS